MGALFRLVARSVLIQHILLPLFVLLGGFLMLMSISAFWIHFPVMLWAVVVNLFGWTCPLTPLEKRFWEAGGREGYEGGFLVHYFGPLLNLDNATRKLEIQTGVVTLSWNVLAYVLVWIVR